MFTDVGSRRLRVSNPAWLRNQAVVLLMGEVAVLVLAAGTAAAIFSTLLFLPSVWQPDVRPMKRLVRDL